MDYELLNQSATRKIQYIYRINSLISNPLVLIILKSVMVLFCNYERFSTSKVTVNGLESHPSSITVTSNHLHCIYMYAHTLQHVGYAHNYLSSSAAKAAVAALGRDIQSGFLPDELEPLVFTFTGAGNVSQVKCMCAFVCVCVCVWMCVCKHACAYMYIHVCLWIMGCTLPILAHTEIGFVQQ